MKKRLNPQGRRPEGPYDEVAVLEMDEAMYAELTRRLGRHALPGGGDFVQYDAWVKQFVQEGARRGYGIAVERGTLNGLEAFCGKERMELDHRALFQYAAHLHSTKQRNT